MLFPHATVGLGLALGAALVVACAPWRGDWVRPPLLLAALALACSPVVRDAGWLVGGNLALALLFASVAAAAPHSWRELSVAPLRFIPYAPAGLTTLAHDASARLNHPAVARGVALAVALVVTFGALFASADGAFAHLADAALPDVDDGPVRLVFGSLGLAVAAGLAMSATGQIRDHSARGFRPAGGLGVVEWGIALGALNLLFAGFVAVQLVVLFGGHEHVLQTAGLTYADYAHQGFGQLLAVAVLVLGVVAASSRYARGHTTLLRVLLGTLCALTLVVVASAVHRLDVYVDAYGATRLRTSALAIVLWVGALVGLTGVALGVAKRGWLPRAAAILTACTAVAFTAYNPDLRIAERSVERARDGERVDRSYLETLSADAVPALAKLPEGCELAAVTPLDDGLLAYNASRARARTRCGPAGD